MSERKTDFFRVMCNFSILPPGRLLAVKNFAQSKNFDPVDILNLHKISFPTVYNTSLSKSFPPWLKILQDYEALCVLKKRKTQCLIIMNIPFQSRSSSKMVARSALMF